LQFAKANAIITVVMSRVAPLDDPSPAHPQGEGAFKQNEAMQGASVNNPS
jgi:hypothetical protein